VKTIVDAGPLVALLNRRDSFHEWVTQALKALPLPLLTCEPVLTEAAHLTGKPAALLAMLGEGSLKIGIELDEQGDAVRRLLDRYGARMSLADASVVRMSELSRRSRVFTLDRADFSVYRRNGREVIPLIAP
jgi:predicted nucleic acid-binding protein